MTPATAVVADTQILIWYFIESARLSPAATAALEAATAAGEHICVSAHSLVELVYAVEKPTNALTAGDRQDILDALSAEHSPFTVTPVSAAIANRVAGVPRVVNVVDKGGASRIVNADPADRIIVATAEELGLPLVSADRKLTKMTSTTVIW